MGPAYKANRKIQVKEWLRSIARDPAQLTQPKVRRICPCCGYEGVFISMRRHLREKRCPNCASRPRDRLLAHAMQTLHIRLEGQRVLHFSPEPNLFRRLLHQPDYVSADIKPSKYARYSVDVTDIGYPEGYFDLIICNHVMEHVADHEKGFAECYRVLKPGGVAFFSVPWYAERETTWYPPETLSEAERDAICGWDHKRLYGADFAAIVARAGFSVDMYSLQGAEADTYRTDVSDPIFIARKPT